MSPAKGKRRPSGATPAPAEAGWDLKLYIAGYTPRAVQALDNLKRVCEEYLPGMYNIEVVDLLRNPRLARGDQIVAVPTLVRKLPAPARRIIGDLSNRERVLVGLDLRPRRRSETPSG